MRLTSDATTMDYALPLGSALSAPILRPESPAWIRPPAVAILRESVVTIQAPALFAAEQPPYAGFLYHPNVAGDHLPAQRTVDNAGLHHSTFRFPQCPISLAFTCRRCPRRVPPLPRHRHGRISGPCHAVCDRPFDLLGALVPRRRWGEDARPAEADPRRGPGWKGKDFGAVVAVRCPTR